MPFYLSFVLTAILLLLIPLCFLAWLAFGKSPSRFDLLLRTVGVGAFLLWLFVIGRWDLFGIWLRYVFLLGFVLVTIYAWIKSRHTPLFPALSIRSGLLGLGQALPAAFFLLLLFQLQGYASYSGRPLHLDFPLRDSVWHVVHGGSTIAVNHHHKVLAQTYALDIVALNAFGMRARGLLPARLQDYAVYDAGVYSPCSGEVLITKNDRPDMDPPDMDRDRIAGNYIVLNCDDATVILGHLKPNSIKVTSGQLVKGGELIAHVGNSGQTSEPHLHIHAVLGKVTDLDSLINTATPLPILFDEQFLIRNANDTAFGNLDIFLTRR